MSAIIKCKGISIIFKYYRLNSNRKLYGKFWRRSSFVRNVLKVKHNHLFDLPDNKNIGKLFSKYKLFPLNQANFTSD